ncbi:head decoration protein [Azospirillum doebereinerae]|uniref:Head decoration protein n=1 Tax=Azospirillum doebereinerae TaxID=92933 RepID=A0A433J4U9_9PROT|nr:head decoration protein [Azospirillum doebereinerae]RUQ67454.1 head decoration protein [Azospirillum doebereinerae]
MATFTEGMHAGEFLVSEANGRLSRATITVASGAGKLQAGTVLATLTAGGKHVPYDNAGTDGSETAAAILYAGVDATAADVKATGIVRLAEVAAEALVWADGLDAAGKTAGLADLAAAFVIAR